MKIIQATFGVFHHFELARELDRRGHLERIYSTFPWKRLEREGVPHDKVETFPWMHTPQVMLQSRNLLPQALKRFCNYRVATTLDTWMSRRMPPCDALIALSGAGLKAGRLLQSRGGIFLCDRGSTHHAYQTNILREEHRIWNVPYPTYDPRVEPREIEIYHQADGVVVPSNVCRDSFLQHGLAPERVHVIPYGVRLENFRPDGAPPAGPDATFEVLFVGSVSLRKGIPYLLKAFAALPHTNKRLLIIGGLDPSFAPLLATLPQENVEFLGTMPQPKLIPYMSRSHVMVLPSIEEGLALVQGQAMACGCPVIASVATGSADLFTDGVEGFIIPMRSVDEIVDRLQRFVDDPTLRDRMSTAALARVQSIGGWREYGDHWENLLHRLTGKA
ncbi:glycosyltransferase [Terriglobus roseus DSM 18391]|uniref:Glycosyltransferase n=1 Tax=Terriglobus roseus (strain DSM 18391 / NRRL B-41598 / KBS 63) TaxID=926566 RepID=I3ZBZ7_TERRK|nr:glycosyltransferase [Terriglobus roseus]AFL86765.1 glycosyltransferase [Terriglobus roseus DSM 18391]